MTIEGVNRIRASPKNVERIPLTSQPAQLRLQTLLLLPPTPGPPLQTPVPSSFLGQLQTLKQRFLFKQRFLLKQRFLPRLSPQPQHHPLSLFAIIGTGIVHALHRLTVSASPSLVQARARALRPRRRRLLMTKRKKKRRKRKRNDGKRRRGEGGRKGRRVGMPVKVKG